MTIDIRERPEYHSLISRVIIALLMTLLVGGALRLAITNENSAYFLAAMYFLVIGILAYRAVEKPDVPTMLRMHNAMWIIAIAWMIILGYLHYVNPEIQVSPESAWTHFLFAQFIVAGLVEMWLTGLSMEDETQAYINATGG